MSVPPRPQHVVSRRRQFQRWRETTLERLRLTRSLRSPPAPADVDAARSGSMVPGVLLGAAFALLGLGMLWGWQTWSGRVSEPIDDRLPMLVSSTSAEVESDLAVESPGPATMLDHENVAPGTLDEQTGAPSVTASVEPERVVVHVAGAVERPGVVTLDAGARIVDALERAGGPTREADLDRVNLAAIVLDGERIHVPAHGEDRPPVVVAPDRAASGAPNGAVAPESTALILDINTATAEALEALPGVGPSIAQAIVQTRVNRGPFLAVEELLDVPGIGEAKLIQIEPYVQVGR